MTYKRKQLPKYCRHKATNRAFVRIEGKAYYLGKYNSDESRKEYDRIIGEFLANGLKTDYQSEIVLIENLIGKFLNYIKTERNYSQGTVLRILIAATLGRLQQDVVKPVYLIGVPIS